MEDGPQLLLRERPSLDLEGLQPFGDRSRPSASLMFAPIRSGGGAVGVLTVQSYSPDAYTEADLVTLQALADHCGGRWSASRRRRRCTGPRAITGASSSWPTTLS